MKFAVTAVAMSRMTRRRVGKARTEIVDTEENELFHNRGVPITIPLDVELAYESFWNDLNKNSTDIVKVVDVRKL